MIADVVIAGAGPTGLMLACELSLAGIARPIVLERLPEASREPKANGLVGQVVKLIERRGLYERFSGGSAAPKPNSAYFMFAALPLDLSLLPASPIYTLPIPQQRIEELLRERAIELGVEIRQGHQLIDLTQKPDSVTVQVKTPDRNYELTTSFLVGADGGHSTTRKLTGIDFPGVSYDRTTSRTANAIVPTDWIDPNTGALNVPGYGTILPFLPHRTEHGGFAYAPIPGRTPLLMTSEWDQTDRETPMSLTEMQDSIHRVLGAPIPLTPPDGEGPHLLRRLNGGNIRMAERFRDRRVLLIGDAAHVFAAGGGQGLNLGMQDAINLGWKIAAEIRGDAPTTLLDSYETERQAAARRVNMYGQAQSALQAPGSDVTALRELFTELLGNRDTVQHLADLTAGSDLQYDMKAAGGHPLLGRCAPDLELQTGTGTVTLPELTTTARPILIDQTENASAAQTLSRWRDRVDIVIAKPETDSTATTMLIRPDSYVAWAASSTHLDQAELTELENAAARWFGAAMPVLGRGITNIVDGWSQVHGPTTRPLASDP